MARAGSQRKTATHRASDVRERLLAAGADVLRDEGFFDASARAIADRAGVAVGGIHYHFESVEALLLEAFDRSNTERLDDYKELVQGSSELPALMAAARTAFDVDRASGRFRMLAQMMAAAASSGTLREAVRDRTEPWVELAEGVVRDSVGDEPFGVLRARDVAVGVVALFIGLELLDEVDGELFDTSGLVDRGGQLAAMLARAFGGAPPDAS